MIKHFKLKFFISLFQLYRSKDPSNLPTNPISKAHNVGYPNIPSPPPLTPSHDHCNHQLKVMKTYKVEGKGRESFVVVKRLKDPYKDSKRSMMKMIIKMEMFEAKELEQLLECFLILNSHQYHEVIVRAFTNIWYEK